VQHSPTKQEENNNSTPENPLILPRAPLHHPDRIPAYAERVRNTIQSSLSTFQYLALLTQISEHRPAPVQEVV
jgi:hypothetical protein